MSEYDNYVGIFEAWEATMKLRSSEEKKKKPNYLSTAFLVLACTFSGMPPDREYKLFKAMINLIQEENPRKLDENEIDLLAGILLVAAEVRRQNA